MYRRTLVCFRRPAGCAPIATFATAARRWFLVGALAAATSLHSGEAGAVGPATAERIPVARTLPADTLLYAYTADAAALRAEWWETALGRMVQDPQLRPFIDQAFAALETAFAPARERTGLTLAEWLELPQGEFCFALLPVEGKAPAAVFYLEAADDDPTIGRLIDQGRRTALAAGMIEETEAVGDVTLTILRSGAGRANEVLYVRTARTLIVSTDRDAAKRVLELRRGESSDGTLAAQPAFVSLERTIGRAEGKPAHLLLYLDPIQLVRRVSRGGAQVALAMLPALGLDGLTAVGGSLTFNRGPFEIIGQGQVLLDVPRAGVVELIALQPTPTEPEPWVPAGLLSYTTFSWDTQRTYHTLRTLVDSFQGEGSFRRNFRDRMQQDVDVDFETDVLAELTGRASLVVAVEEPLSPSSRAHLLGVEIKDRGRAEAVLKKLLAQGNDPPELKSFGGRSYYEAQPRRRPPRGAEAQGTGAGAASEPPERPNSGFCIVDGFVLVADHVELLRRALAALDDESQRLATSLDYKLIAGKAKRYAGENGPGLLSFYRPDEEIRYLYGLAVNQRLREQMARGGEKNPLLKDLHAALEDRPLPPLEALQRYYAPGGTIVVDEPTGLRYLSFVLRRESPK